MEFTCRRGTYMYLVVCWSLIAMISVGVEAQVLIGPSPADEAVLINSMHTLSCRRGPDGATGLISWEHSLPGSLVRSTIFIGEDRQNLDTRYDNFAIDPDSLYDLIITNMAIEDEGTFYCRDLSASDSETSVVRTVEVAGDTPVMTPLTGGEVTVIEGEISAIMCTATGYRPVVTIEWYHKMNGGQESQITDGVTQTEGINPGDSDLFDVVSTLQYTANKGYNNGELKCITTGQRAAQSQEKIASLNVQYEPLVNVQYGSDEVKCSSDANPAVPEPNGYKIIINNTDADAYTPTCTDGICILALKVDYDTDVRCNATNDVGMGTDTTVAIPGAVITTTPSPEPTKTTKPGGGDKDAISTDAGPNVGAIAAGVVVGIIVLAVIIALLVYFLVIRKGNKTKNSQGSELKPVNGSGGDSSKPKDRPTPAPRNSKGDAHDNEEGKKKVKPNDNPDGLLYAQLDHSNKPARNSGNGNNIIRTEEPTEYADVKTFIV